MLYSTIMLFSEFFGYTLNSFLASLFNTPWPPQRCIFVTAALVHSISSMGASACLFLVSRDGPTRLLPSDPGYTAAGAEAYHLWMVVKLPLLAVLHATCAVFLVLDCAMWLRWDLDRKEEARRSRDMEMQDRRWRAACYDGRGVGGEAFVATGVDQG